MKPRISMAMPELGVNALVLGSLVITWGWFVAEMVVMLIEYTAERTSDTDCIAVLAFAWIIGTVLLVFGFAYGAYLGLVNGIE